MNSETRTCERQRLLIDLLERKIRLRAQQLYDERGQENGRALEDWIQAENEVLKANVLAPLWNARRQQQAGEC